MATIARPAPAVRPASTESAGAPGLPTVYAPTYRHHRRQHPRPQQTSSVARISTGWGLIQASFSARRRFLIAITRTGVLIEGEILKIFFTRVKHGLPHWCRQGRPAGGHSHGHAYIYIYLQCAGSCRTCSNINCAGGKYRVSSCSGTSNGYYCATCASCSAGKYRVGGCSGTTNSICANIPTPPPPTPPPPANIVCGSNQYRLGSNPGKFFRSATLSHCNNKNRCTATPPNPGSSDSLPVAHLIFKGSRNLVLESSRGFSPQCRGQKATAS